MSAATVSTLVEHDTPVARLLRAIKGPATLVAVVALAAGCAGQSPVSSSSAPPRPAGVQIAMVGSDSGVPQTDNGNGCPTTGRVTYYFPDKNMYASRYYDGASQQESEAGTRTRTPGLCQEIVGREYLTSLLGIVQNQVRSINTKPEQFTTPMLKVLDNDEPESEGDVDRFDGSVHCYNFKDLGPSSVTIKEGTIQAETIRLVISDGRCKGWSHGLAKAAFDYQFAPLPGKTWLLLTIKPDPVVFDPSIESMYVTSIDLRKLRDLATSSLQVRPANTPKM